MLAFLLFITNSKILGKPHKKSERSPYRHRRIQEKLGEHLALSVDQGVQTSWSDRGKGIREKEQNHPSGQKV